MADMATTSEHAEEPGTRRDFLYLLTGATAAVGTLALVWPLVDAMNPSADVLALASTEVDLSGVEEGMAITVTWRGKPVFIRHRTPEEIEQRLRRSSRTISPIRAGLCPSTRLAAPISNASRHCMNMAR